jgi:hypothetical protein
MYRPFFVAVDCQSASDHYNNAMHPITRRFKENAQGFGRHWWPVLLLYFAALTADGASTIHFMLHEGTCDTELHPAVSAAAGVLGPVWGPIVGIVGKAVAGLIVAVYWRRIALVILLIATILSLWAAWYNVWGWQYYEPSIYLWWPF